MSTWSNEKPFRSLEQRFDEFLEDNERHEDAFRARLRLAELVIEGNQRCRAFLEDLLTLQTRDGLPRASDWQRLRIEAMSILRGEEPHGGDPAACDERDMKW